MNEYSSAVEQYSNLGYCVGRFDSISAIKEIRNLCENFVETRIGHAIELCDYHKHITSDEIHRNIHYDLTQLLRKKQFHKQLVSDNTTAFANLVGGDIDIQISPYLRISRPNQASDNIGLHRDTFYGNSPYEISCIVAIDNFSKGAGVNVWPKSQHLGQVEYIQTEHESVKKGSKQNDIGFLYAPKELLNVKYDELHAPELKIGEYLMFSLGLIHGQEVNSSGKTRWSMDFRFKNSFHVQTDDLKKSYYEKLCKSPATIVGEQYLDSMSMENNQ